MKRVLQMLLRLKQEGAITHVDWRKATALRTPTRTLQLRVPVTVASGEKLAEIETELKNKAREGQVVIVDGPRIAQINSPAQITLQGRLEKTALRELIDELERRGAVTSIMKNPDAVRGAYTAKAGKGDNRITYGRKLSPFKPSEPTRN